MPIEVLKRKMTRRGGTAVAYNVKLQAKKKKKKISSLENIML